MQTTISASPQHQLVNVERHDSKYAKKNSDIQENAISQQVLIGRQAASIMLYFSSLRLVQLQTNRFSS